jgi:hypothetical protein
MTTIRAFESYLYVEVRTVTEYKQGRIYKTEHKGYAKRERPVQDNEVYCSISTNKFIQGQFTCSLL